MVDTDGSRGTLLDTYVAALQHDLVDLPGDARHVGVVRRPSPWLYGQVDENRRSLGPPDELLDEFKRRSDRLREQGLEDATAHNRAAAETEFFDRYRAYLVSDHEPQSDIEDLLRLLQNGDDVVLVCYENTEKKGCHRLVLADYLRSMLD